MIKKNKRTKNLVFISLLLCYILISLFEPFGIVKAYAGINRVVLQAIVIGLQSLIIMEI